MHPYLESNFLSFIGVLWKRLFLFLIGVLKPDELMAEDMQFLALLLSGLLGLIVGFYLIYNKMTMLANSLSHTVLLGLGMTFLAARMFNPQLGVDDLSFYLQLIAALLTAIVTMIGFKFLLKHLSQEAANALSFTAFFALGILLTSVVLKNTHLGLEAVIGNLEAITYHDIKRLGIALGLISIVFYLIRTKLTLISFDELFAKTIGINTDRYKHILIFISAFVLMVCFRSMGVILILSMLSSPILIARLWTCSRKTLFAIAFLSLLIQITFSLALVQWLYIRFNLPVSTSGLFSFLSFVSYIFVFYLTKIKKCHTAFLVKKTYY